MKENETSKIQNMFLKLNRPLIFFDIESTGTDTRKDRIVELSTIKLTPNGQSETITQRFNPSVAISEGAMAVHKIKDEDVINEPRFSDKAKEIYDYFLGCDLGGFNVNFDVRMLSEELLRSSTDLPFDNKTKIIDAMVIFKKMEKRDLATAYKFYCGKELTNAHQAEADTVAAMEVLQEQIKKYSLNPDLEYLVEMSKYDSSSEVLDFAGKFLRNEDRDIVFNLQNHKGKKVLEDPGLLKWMLKQDFFDRHTLYIARQIIEGKLK